MRRKRGKTGAAVLGAGLIALAFAALAGLAVAGLMLRPPPTNSDTLCRTDAPLGAHTLILIDATDKLERRHRRRLEAVAANERARLSQYERLTLMRIDARRPREPAVLFSKCLPKPPEQANFLFENPRQVEAQWNEEFADALDHALGRAGSSRGQRASPLLDALRAAAADPDFGAEIPVRRLVLVSDLLEHDPEGFSLYAPGADYAAWSSGAAGAARGAPDLSGVDVRLAPLDRPEHSAAQAAALEGFWGPYFEAADARTVNIDPSY
jgi:hypothetical protein